MFAEEVWHYAGVPISRTVGGVACGLITLCGIGDDRGEVTQHRVLTDLLVRSHCTCGHIHTGRRRIHHCDVTLPIFLASKQAPYSLLLLNAVCVCVINVIICECVSRRYHSVCGVCEGERV